MLWAGLPFVYDDPSDLKQMKSMITTAFGGGLIGHPVLPQEQVRSPWCGQMSLLCKPCHKRKTSIYIETRIQPNLIYGMGVELLTFLV